MNININDIISVKLTAKGRKVLRDHPYAAFSAQDKDGWSEWQLWELMRVFGPHLGNGLDVPFETTIRLKTSPSTETPAAARVSERTRWPGE